VCRTVRHARSPARAQVGHRGSCGCCGPFAQAKRTGSGTVHRSWLCGGQMRRVEGLVSTAATTTVATATTTASRAAAAAATVWSCQSCVSAIAPASLALAAQRSLPADEARAVNMGQAPRAGARTDELPTSARLHAIPTQPAGGRIHNRPRWGIQRHILRDNIIMNRLQSGTRRQAALCTRPVPGRHVGIDTFAAHTYRGRACMVAYVATLKPIKCRTKYLIVTWAQSDPVTCYSVKSALSTQRLGRLCFMMFFRVCAELQRAAEHHHHQAVRCWLTVAAKGPVCHAQWLSQQTGEFLHMLCYVRHKVAHIQSHTDSLSHTQTHGPGLIRHQTATAGCAGATHWVGLTPLGLCWHVWGATCACLPACLPTSARG
jgi:hypothetical protein